MPTITELNNFFDNIDKCWNDLVKQKVIRYNKGQLKRKLQSRINKINTFPSVTRIYIGDCTTIKGLDKILSENNLKRCSNKKKDTLYKYAERKSRQFFSI